MKQILVSTDVFARIWSIRQPGEDTEDSILRRALNASSSDLLDEKRPDGGIFDRRHKVSFQEGFEVFRAYLGNNYRARAVEGRWKLEDGRECATLNELSRAIGAKTENAWQNWYFSDASGRKRPVSDLRDPITVSVRKGEGGEKENMGVSRIEEAREPLQEGTWRDDVRTALLRLGGRAPLHRIYREVEAVRRAAERSIPPTLEATIRRTLEDHSSDSANFRGADLFHMPEGKGAGFWALRE